MPRRPFLGTLSTLYIRREEWLYRRQSTNIVTNYRSKGKEGSQTALGNFDLNVNLTTDLRLRAEQTLF